MKINLGQFQHYDEHFYFYLERDNRGIYIGAYFDEYKKHYHFVNVSNIIYGEENGFYKAYISETCQNALLLI